MNCPVCDRSLAPTLSICPSCGAMMFDSVREELQTKITSGRLAPRTEIKQVPISATFSAVITEKPASVPTPAAPKPFAPRLSAGVSAPRAAAAVAMAPQPVKRIETAELTSPKTSPTLVGFQSKNATLPDWRLQLQNAVQQRKGGRSESPAVVQTGPNTQFRTNGSAAIKAEIVSCPDLVDIEPAISDPRVANAIKRITESRNAFLEPEKKFTAPKPVVATAKPYKFDVVATNPAAVSPASSRPSMVPKPRLVSPAPTALKRDTNKLPPLSMGVSTLATPGPIAEVPIEVNTASDLPVEFSEIKRIRIIAEHHETDDIDALDVETDDIEDLAYFSTRFGAGLFDLIIAGFASLVILSPIAFTRGEWLTAAGLLTFCGVCAIVTFFYMTICLGFYGKTMGMRLFSLELVDAVENEYPTLHQAAVSSSVYLISLVFGGAGFLTIFFNEEKRAAHDLLSGTILVREF